MFVYRWHDNARHSRGFTMLELLVVMIIITITFFAVRPNLVNTIKFDRERAAVRNIVALLTSARTEAVIKGRLVRIAIAPQQTRLWAELQAEPDNTVTTRQAANQTDYREQFEVVSLMGRSSVALPTYLQITDLTIGGTEFETQTIEKVIYFYPTGRTSGATLSLRGETGQEYIIELSPATGKVHISA